MVTLDIPRDLDLLNGEHVILLEIPNFLAIPGFFMVIFGA